MSICRRMLAAGLAAGFAACFQPAALAAKPDRLTPEQMAAATRIDSVSVPTPGELFAAIDKMGKPNWQSQYRKPIETGYTSRPQIALNLGGLVADGYIAVEAEDSQQVKNIGKDIESMAKSLGVSQNILSRGGSITEFAENNEWSALKEELEATQNEVKLAMDDQHDNDLVVLVSLGGWIRGTEVVSSWMTKNYTPENAKLLRQPALIAYLRGKIHSLSGKIQEDPLVSRVNRELEQMQGLVSFPRETPPTLDDVKKLKDSASALVQEISAKKE